MLEFSLNRLNEIIEKLGKRIKELEAELENSRWIPVSESLPGKKYWGKKIWIIIDKQPSCQSYYGKRIGMTYWMPIILP